MPESTSRLKLFLPLVIFIVLALVFYTVLTSKDYDPNHLPSALVGEPFPEFTLKALTSDKTLTKADIIGTPMLVNLWATWCISCKVEHPFLNKLKQEGIKIIGIDYKDDNQKALEWLNDLGNPYDQVIVDAEGDLGLDLGVYGAPETFLVDASGQIRHKFVGVIDEAVWQRELKPLFIEMQVKP